MPRNVARFEQLAYASLMLGLIVGALDFETLLKLGSTASIIGTTIGTIAVTAMLIWLTARRQQSWARWLLLGFFLLGLPFFLMNLGQQSLMTALLSVLQAVMQGCAVYFVFTGDCEAWFVEAQPAQLPEIAMPTSIIRFEQLAYAGLLLALAAAPFDLLRVTRELRGSAAAITAGKVGAILGEFLGIGIGWLLIWLIARRRKAWARWLFLAFYVAILAYFIINVGEPELWLDSLYALQIILWAGALYLAFTTDARSWFMPMPSAPPVEPKARMRAAAGRREVLEPTEVDHRGKVDAHIAEMGQLGVGRYMVAPPPFQLLWDWGVEVPPPLFLRFAPMMLIAGIPVAVVWALLNLAAGCQTCGRAPLWVGISAAAVVGALVSLMFGAIVAAYYRREAQRLALPSWESYLPMR